MWRKLVQEYTRKIPVAGQSGMAAGKASLGPVTLYTSLCWSRFLISGVASAQASHLLCAWEMGEYIHTQVWVSSVT